MQTNNKLRETLEKISLLSSSAPPHWKPIAVIVEIGKLADAALAEPVRNCDVGTAGDQYARWRAFCDTQNFCRECKVYRTADVCASKSRCNLTWAQMPYESMEGGAS